MILAVVLAALIRSDNKEVDASLADSPDGLIVEVWPIFHATLGFLGWRSAVAATTGWTPAPR